MPNTQGLGSLTVKLEAGLINITGLLENLQKEGKKTSKSGKVEGTIEK